MRDEVVLIDAGEGRRLERFGPRVVDRSAAAATGPARAPERWSEADLRFDAGFGWSAPRGDVDPAAAWVATIDGLTLELRPTTSGGVGLYPEHAANLDWLAGCVARRGPASAPAVLNLFAHTGLATLALARAGAAVVHVDAARAAVAWARRNATLSGLADRSVRWLVDDALTFVEREARRGRRYAGFVLDPPSFGRAGGGRGAGRPQWTLRRDLAELLAACAAVAADEAFVLLTAHTTGTDPDELAQGLGVAFGVRTPTPVPLVLDAESGARLELGWAVRLDPLDGSP